MSIPCFPRAAGALAAGAMSVVILVLMMIQHAWPLWTGRVVAVPVTLSPIRDAFRGEGVTIVHGARHLSVGDPAAVKPPEGAVVVRPQGDWWNQIPGDPHDRRRDLVGRAVYVQLEPDLQSQYRPVTISDVPVPGALNLKGRVHRIDPGGSLDVSYGIESYFVEEGRSQQIADAVKAGNGPTRMEIAIAPSGRARIKALVIPPWPSGKP